MYKLLFVYHSTNTVLQLTTDSSMPTQTVICQLKYRLNECILISYNILLYGNAKTERQ